MPLLDGLEVVRSAIHGYGLVARRAFARGETIIVGDGVLWRDGEEFDDEYALVLDEIDGMPGAVYPLYYDLADQTRWINHSCAPNAQVDAAWVPDLGRARAWWRALRDIAPGEEITYDYAFSGHLAVPCTCGAATCRGLIVDPDELHLVPERYRRLLR